MKKIGVLGGRESGINAALLAVDSGYDVFLSELSYIDPASKELLSNKGIEYEEGRHSLEILSTLEEVIISPGVPTLSSAVQYLKKHGINVISEVEFAARYISAPIIGITGTNGKSTVTSMIGHVLETAGYRVSICGNIGYSISKAVRENRYEYKTDNVDHSSDKNNINSCIDHPTYISDVEYFVVELSSYQLENIQSFHPFITVILQITPDHLDRYEDKFGNYFSAKMNILNNINSDDYVVIYNDPYMVDKVKTQGKKIFFGDDGFIYDYLGNNNISLSEEEYQEASKIIHIISNLYAAMAVCSVLGISTADFMDSLVRYSGLEHRMEYVGKIYGRKFYNDSKATNIHSAKKALLSFDTVGKNPGNTSFIDKSIIWIMGGEDKGNDYTEIKDILEERVKSIIILAQNSTEFVRKLSPYHSNIQTVHNMREAIDTAYRQSHEGDIILLSPACASFDLFHNFEDRGHKFKDQFEELRRRVED